MPKVSRLASSQERDLEFLLTEGQTPALRREETKCCPLWPVGELQTDGAEAAPGEALRLAGRVAGPCGSVSSAEWASTHCPLVHLARPKPGPLVLASLSSSLLGGLLERDKGHCGSIEVRKGCIPGGQASQPSHKQLPTEILSAAALPSQAGRSN